MKIFQFTHHDLKIKKINYWFSHIQAQKDHNKFAEEWPTWDVSDIPTQPRGSEIDFQTNDFFGLCMNSDTFWAFNPLKGKTKYH